MVGAAGAEWPVGSENGRYWLVSIGLLVGLGDLWWRVNGDTAGCWRVSGGAG